MPVDAKEKLVSQLRGTTHKFYNETDFNTFYSYT